MKSNEHRPEKTKTVPPCPKLWATAVAQISKSAVSQVSKPANLQPAHRRPTYSTQTTPTEVRYRKSQLYRVVQIFGKPGPWAAFRAQFDRFVYLARHMHTQIVRVYHQSLWFWLQRILFVVFVASICVCISQSHRSGAIVASLLFMSLGAISSFGMFALDPLAVEIHPDFFALRFLWKRQKYPFADVNYITRGQVLLPRSGIVETVKVGFRCGHPLQLKFLVVREKLYRALITAWHATTDDPPGQYRRANGLA